jgi:hypothetical protein
VELSSSKPFASIPRQIAVVTLGGAPVDATTVALRDENGRRDERLTSSSISTGHELICTRKSRPGRASQVVGRAPKFAGAADGKRVMRVVHGGCEPRSARAGPCGGPTRR